MSRTKDNIERLLVSSQKQKEIAVAKFVQLKLKCPSCTIWLKYEQRYNRFCSRSCSGKYNNALRFKDKHKTCKVCVKEIRFYLVYCVECRGKGLHKIRDISLAKSDDKRKEILLETRGNKCEICTINSWNNKSIVLQLDHVDGNSDNNSENNLRLLCPNCHSQTETFCGKNIGKAGIRGQLRTTKIKLKLRPTSLVAEC